MDILTAELDDLIPDPQNPRAHPAENITAIKESLSRFGQVLPVLVRNSDCQIVAGNGTVTAMRELGWTRCTVALYDGDDQECRALSVALNRTGELATWDEENLAAVVGELRASGFEAMGSLGFSSEALDDLAAGFQAPDYQPLAEQESRPLAKGVTEMDVDNLTADLDQECPRCKFRFKAV